MSTYRRYQEARDTAWRALLQGGITGLPVDVDALARRVGAEVLPFPGEDEPKLGRLIRQAGGGVCASLRIRGRWHIFLRQDHLDDSRRRFAVAHELGHLLLGHGTRSLAPGVRAFESRENQGDLMEDPESLDDYAADIFAIRLLAPACVLHEMRLDRSGPIMALCGLPPRAAAMRAERMQLLNERDVFYNHPLERQVRDQFLPFLRSRKTEAVRLSAASGPPAQRPPFQTLPHVHPAAFPGAAQPQPDQPRHQAAAPLPDELLQQTDARTDLENTSGSAHPPEGAPFPWLPTLALALFFGVLLFFLFRTQ